METAIDRTAPTGRLEKFLKCEWILAGTLFQMIWLCRASRYDATQTALMEPKMMPYGSIFWYDDPIHSEQEETSNRDED